MDDIFLCPDCHAEHQEPLEASLGHVARCLTCELTEGARSIPVQIPPVRATTIAVETHLAA
jgi:hypothetical protein